MADLNTGMRNMASEGLTAEQRQQGKAPGTSSDSGKAAAGTSKAEVREDHTVHNIPGAFPGDGDDSAANSTQNTVPGGFPDEYGISEGSQPQTSTAEHQATAASKGPMTNAATSLGHGPTGHPVVSGINDKDLAKGHHATDPDGGPRNPTDRTPPSTNPPALSELGGRDSDSSHPTPPKQFEVGDNSNIGPHGLQHRTPRQADGKPAPGSKGVGQEAVSIEESPAKTQDQGTVKPGELAEQVARGAATAAVAGGLAAKDAALWAKDKAVENYPAARDKTVENATWAKDRAAENYPAVRDTTVENATWAKDRAAENYPAARDQTVNAATSAGNAAYSGAATAASAISNTTQSAIQAATEALPGAVKNRLWTGTSAEAPKPEPAAGVPKTVQDSLSRAGESPEAAANPEAVGDKHKLESELLNIAGSAHKDDEDKKAEGAPDKMVEGASDKKSDGADSDKTDVPLHKGAGTTAGVGALAGHMPNRTESTDFVKIISTETYKPQAGRAADNDAHKSGAGLGAAAQETSPAHGGGPAPKDAGSVAGGTSAGSGQFEAVLGSDGMQKHGSEGQRGDTEYTYGQNELKDARNDMRPKDEAIPGTAVETGLGGGSGLPTSLQAAQRGDNVPRSLQGAAAAGAPSAAAAQAAGPGSDAPPSYGQSQQQERVEPVRKTVGDDGVREVDYNKLSSGTPSGVAGTHYSSK